MENNQQDNLQNPVSIESGIETGFISEVTSLLKNLFYPSESDEPIEWIKFNVNVKDGLTVSDLEFFLGCPPSVKAEEIPTDNFWAPLLAVEEWYGDEERAQVENFKSVKQLLETNLNHLKAFRVGQIEIDLYLVGQLNEKEWGGLKTLLVET
ncbi:nuclease A inhibitor family protein [Runella salmonicolor]|uniref:Nuclease A inhibitor family protein n=1 Tax=Runella salmonicolor TaxID=2950278 RepID=A0ABT1FV20_9BACT|nr:nuclease A inhibitor family protein [Runella salmonicolor]MCP1385617.1 nuclease A inhibitor family protein [Runella salmonicolor]